MRRWWWVALLWIAHTSLAHAGGFHITLIGIRRTALGANLASPDDASAIFHNPAGLADQRGLQLQVGSGLTLLHTGFTLQALDASRFPEVNAPHCDERGNAACAWKIGSDGYYEEEIGPEHYVGVVPFVGATYDLEPLAPWLSGTTAGLALYAPGAYGADMPEAAPTAYYILRGLFVVSAATAAVGHRVNEHLSLGASLSYNYRRLSFAQKFSVADLLTPAGAVPDTSAQLAQAAVGDLRMDYAGHDHGLGASVGALVTATPWLSIGASAAAWTSAHLRGGVELVGLGSSNFGTPALSTPELRELIRGYDLKLPRSLEVEMPIPPFLGVGVTARPASWFEISVDYRLWLYTLYEKQHLVPAYDASEPGEPALTAAALSKDKGYSNSFDISGGVLVRPFPANRDIELMAGLSFDKSPVPDATFSIDSPSMDQLSFQGGVRARLGERWHVAFSEMFDHYVARDVRNSRTSPATNVRGGGYAHIPFVEARYQL